MALKYKDDLGNVVLWNGDGEPTDDELNQLFEQTSTANGLSKSAQVPDYISMEFPVRQPESGGTPIEFSQPKRAPQQPLTPAEVQQLPEEPVPPLWEGWKPPSLAPAFEAARKYAPASLIYKGIAGEPMGSDPFAGRGFFPEAVRGAQAGVDETIRGFVQFATSPEGLLQLGLAADPVTAGPMAAKFAWDLIHGTGQEAAAVAEAIHKGDTQTAVQHLVQAAASGYMGAQSAAHVIPGLKRGANYIERSADQQYYSTPKGQAEMGEHQAVLGDQKIAGELINERSRILEMGRRTAGETPGVEVDTEMGTRIDEINKQLADMGVDVETGLTPEVTKMIEAASKDAGKPIKVIWNSPKLERDIQASVNKAGEIEIYPENLIRTLEGTAPHRAGKALESIIGEEELHSYVTPEEAKKVWDDTKDSPWGQKLYEDVYRRTPDITDEMMGHEVIRLRLQELRRMGRLETTTGPLGERLEITAKLKLDALMNRMRDRIYKKMKGEDSPTRKVIDAVNSRIEAERMGMGTGGAGPGVDAPFSRVREVDDFLEKLKAGEPLDTHSAVATGMKSKTIEDLDALASARHERVAKQRQLIEKASKETDKSKKDALLNQGMTLNTQLPREAIEAATNTGSHIEGEGKYPISYGERPLDWKKNTEVRKWLSDNAESLRIKLPDDFQSFGQGEMFDQRNLTFASKFALLNKSLSDPRLQAKADAQKKINALMEGSKPGDEPASKFRDKQVADAIKLGQMRAAAQGLRAENFQTDKKPEPEFLPATKAVEENVQAAVMTPQQMEQTAMKVLDSDLPSFQQFTRMLQSGQGWEKLNPQQLGEMWQESIGKWLETATGKQLEDMVNKLKLRTEVIPSALRKKGVGLNISDSNMGETADIVQWRAKQLERATQIDKNVANIENEIRSLEKRIQYGKSGAVPESAVASELLPADELKKSTLTGDELRIQKLKQRAEMYRRESARITHDARPSPSKVENEQLVDTYQTSGAPAEAPKAIQHEFGQLFPTGETMPEGSLQKLDTGPQKARIRIADAIFKALTDAGVESKSVLRKDVDIEDLDWDKGSDAVRSVTAAGLRDPDQVGQELTAGAASNRTTKETIGGGRALAHREAAPESHTKALVAFLDPRNGKVELVSAYRDGRRGPVVSDPLMNGRQITFAQAMGRYKVLDGYLLRHPVKDFHRTYASMDDFNESWRKDIKARADQFAQEPIGLDPNLTYMAPGPQGLEGEGGFVMGPDAINTRLANNMVSGVLDIGADITPAEALVAYQTFSKLESQADAKFVIDDLHKRAQADAKARAAASKKQQIEEQIMRMMEREGKKPKRTIKRTTAGEFVEQEIKTMRASTKRAIAKLQAESAALDETAQSGLTPRDWLLIKAMSKVEESVQRHIDEMNREIAAENKKLPKDQQQDYITYDSHEWTLNELYDLAKRNQTEQAALESAARRYVKEAAPSVPTRRTQTTGARELTMRSWGKRNIEAVPFQQQPVVRPEVGKLSREARAHVARTPYIEKGINDPSSLHEMSKGYSWVDWINHYDEMLNRGGETPASRVITDAMRDLGSSYDEWMADRIARTGGALSDKYAQGFKAIIDRSKELYGQQSKLVDQARLAAGGSVGSRLGQIPNARNIKAVNWLNELKPITKRAATARVVDAMESWYSRGVSPAKWTTLPADVKALINMAAPANLEAGKLLQSVVKGFTAMGKFQRNYTPLGIDILRNGGGTTMGRQKADLWREWTIATAKANKVPLSEVRTDFRALKEELDKPVPDVAHIDKINQDYHRKYPNVVTHLKTVTGWQPVMHADLFNYIETTARRAANIVAFREQFPSTPAGRAALGSVMADLRREIPPEYHGDLDSLIKTLEGHPTDTYNKLGVFGPTRAGGLGLKMFNQTIGNVMAKLVLSGQMIRQPAENLIGATPQFLGYKNYLRAAARLKELYPEMEKAGERNAIIYDFSFDKNSPIRSLTRITGNVISKAFMEQMLNELQEAHAAATARVVSERIKSGNISDWEARVLPETFRQMGFTKEQAADMMKGNVELLNMFQRRASAWLTSGNKSMSEGSALGSNRLFNSVFRFQSYPMMKANQFRKVVTRATEAWTEGGSKQEKLATAELMGRFLMGAALQGFGTTMAAAYFFNGGPSGVQIKLIEAKDQPQWFIPEMFLATIGGPIYLLWQAMNSRGAANVGDAFGRLAFPYAMAREMQDAAFGTGKYQDMEPWDRLGKFVSSKAPGLKGFQNAAALMGLSQQNVKLDAAINAFYRFRNDMEGYTAKSGVDAVSEERSKFRMAMKQAVEAMKRGDREAYLEAYREAAQAPGSKGMDTVAQALRGKKILKAPDGRPLTPDQTQALINRIGESAYERVRYYDAMLDAAADGIWMPKQE